MKRKTIFAAMAAVVALTGCSSQGAGSADSSTSLGVVSNEETEIARVTGEVPQADTSQPPSLGVQYSGDGLAAMALMTLGNYSWDNNGEMVNACGASPVQCALNGNITAKVDLDLVSDGEPKVNLYSGAEITSVTLFPMDGSENTALEYTADGVISFPDSVMSGVVDVAVKFPQGDAEYYFLVERSQTDPSEPPELRVYSGDISFAMTRGGYEWTETTENGAATVTVDCPSPWQMYENGNLRPQLTALPGETFSIMLPENSGIKSAVYYTAEDESHTLEVKGGKVTMPQDSVRVPVCVTVEMPAGTCDYVFSVQTGEEANTGAYSPELPPQLTAYYGDGEYAMKQFNYKWTSADGMEYSTAAADMMSPWNAKDELAHINAEPGSTITIDLPENSGITDAEYQTSSDELWTMEFTAGALTAPEERTEAVCTIRVEMPQGWCDYAFAVNTGDVGEEIME